METWGREERKKSKGRKEGGKRDTSEQQRQEGWKQKRECH